MTRNRKTPQISAWKWIGFCIPFILVLLHFFIKQDTRPFKEQITRTVYARWSMPDGDTLQVQVLGTYGEGSRFIVEDREGNRTCNGRVWDKINKDGLVFLQHEAAYYVAPSSMSDIADWFSGYGLDEIIHQYGDYMACNARQGLYTFPQIVPVIDGKRYEEGLVLTVRHGKVVHATLADPEYTSTNLFLRLPFAEKILALNMGRAHFVPYCNIYPEANEEESSGFLVELIVGLGTFIFGLVAIALFVSLCAGSVGLLWMPLSYYLAYHTRLGNTAIRILIGVLSFPLVYMAAITLSDALSGLWLLVFPYMLVLGCSTAIPAIILSTDNRCPQCHSIGTFHKELIKETLKAESEFCREASRQVLNTSRKGNLVTKEILLTEEVIHRKVMLRTYKTTCTQCTYSKTTTEEENVDKVIGKRNSRTTTQTVESDKLKDKIVYITDEKGRRIRCIQSPYTTELQSDEEPGVRYRRNPNGTFTKI